jgi:hypothetical protein
MDVSAQIARVDHPAIQRTHAGGRAWAHRGLRPAPTLPLGEGNAQSCEHIEKEKRTLGWSANWSRIGEEGSGLHRGLPLQDPFGLDQHRQKKAYRSTTQGTTGTEVPLLNHSAK